MTLRALIVDDEPLARRVLEKYIGQTPAVELVAACADAEEARAALDQHDVELLFLDIRMPGMSGMEFARSLGGGPMIVFVTAFPEYAAEGFELEAVDYLVKPFPYERFEQAVRKAHYLLEVEARHQATTEPVLLVKSDKKLYRLPFKTILYLEGYGDYVKVHTTRTKTLLTKETLKHLERQLPAELFIRIHRSYIISVQAIQFMEGNQVSVNDQLLPVSESHRKQLLERMG
ncbi:MAG: LytTR family DNA-binding domain-containing protein [Saprospiraceae bacterium]|nr:LytTR family DNA-binding domain-containing protein [Saprospiraceae bacterium]